jgi:hypothetical protein
MATTDTMVTMANTDIMDITVTMVTMDIMDTTVKLQGLKLRWSTSSVMARSPTKETV